MIDLKDAVAPSLAALILQHAAVTAGGLINQISLSIAIVTIVLTPQIAGHNLKNKLGLIKFGNHDINTKKIYS